MVIVLDWSSRLFDSHSLESQRRQHWWAFSKCSSTGGDSHPQNRRMHSSAVSTRRSARPQCQAAVNFWQHNKRDRFAFGAHHRKGRVQEKSQFVIWHFVLGICFWRSPRDDRWIKAPTGLCWRYSLHLGTDDTHSSWATVLVWAAKGTLSYPSKRLHLKRVKNLIHLSRS